MDKWETDLKASFENYATITFNKISDNSNTNCSQFCKKHLSGCLRRTVKITYEIHINATVVSSSFCLSYM